MNPLPSEILTITYLLLQNARFDSVRLRGDYGLMPLYQRGKLAGELAKRGCKK